MADERFGYVDPSDFSPGKPMPSRIEDYAVIGNCETIALVGRNGSIDWLGLPRFDSPACMAALLGAPENGRWLIAPTDPNAHVTRHYLGDTLVLETQFATDAGAVCVIDFLHRRDGAADLVRLVRGLRGSVSMRTELIVRFDYGAAVPWVTRREDGRLQMISGPDRLLLDTAVELRGEDMRTLGDFDVKAGEEVAFVLTWTPSYKPEPEPIAATTALRDAEAFWSRWVKPFKPMGEWSDAVLRSLLTLKALSHWETGGIVAAATTSLPEQLGGSRNWDYRFCWLRDATFTLYALMEVGFLDEAKAWRDWLLRAAAGSPDQLQIMYGVAGERRLDEYTVPWLTGYEGAAPVRIGNAAAGQVQLDVYGEVLDALYVGRRAGLGADASSWALECALVVHLEAIWSEPDDGIWEVRGGRQQFTHSKVMAWVAFDRAVRSAAEFGLTAPLSRWRTVRDRIHQEVCDHGFNPELNSFVQSYGAATLDAALLLIPLVGFLPASDPRVRGTVAAVEQRLMRDGFVLRYDTGVVADGLPPGEGAFLACSFWLVDNYVLQERYDEAQALFNRLLTLRNDVGLLAEEYDAAANRFVGNFPQAFSHLALINSAHNLATARGPAHRRAAGSSKTGDPEVTTSRHQG
jgi:GH15 family glucan-1,4-alpha-glucosidase